MNTNIQLAIDWVKQSESVMTPGGYIASPQLFQPFSRREIKFLVKTFNKMGFVVERFGKGALLRKEK